MLELKANPNKQAKGAVIEARLDKTKGNEKSLLKFYDSDRDMFTPMPDKIIKDKSYHHDLRTIDSVIPTKPVYKDLDNEDYKAFVEKYKAENMNTELIGANEEYYDIDYDTALLHEVWDWVNRKPQGIAYEISNKLTQIIAEHGEENVAAMLNVKQDEMPELNKDTTYAELKDLLSLFESIERLLNMDLEMSKSLTQVTEQFEGYE